MPQPLKKFITNRAAIVFAGGLQSRPKMAELVGHCIVEAAEVELQYGILLEVVLGSKPELAFSIFEAIRGQKIRSDILRNIGRDTITDHDRLALFYAILTYCSSVFKARNKIAHHIWAISDDIPDKAILVEPINFIKLSKPSHDAGLYEGAMVYSEGDLTRIMKSLSEASSMVAMFRSDQSKISTSCQAEHTSSILRNSDVNSYYQRELESL